MTKVLFFLFGCLFLFPYCSGEETGPPPGTEEIADLGDVEVEEMEEVAFDVFDVSEPDDLIEEEFVPEKGEFGWPCADNSECNSNWCIDSHLGKICTELCFEECPDGFICKGIFIAPDTIFICVPLFMFLCDPCLENKDCNSELTGGEAVCRDYGAAGKFCTGDCTKTGTCPKGYTCVADASFGSTKQCLPDDNECECSNRAKQLGLSTTCYVENAFGKCMGERKCEAAGLTQCDAMTPEPEMCDNIDNDCNGLTDDSSGEIECFVENEFGTCPGKGLCVEGEVVCMVGQVAAPEQCNGIDDDCDGTTDEGLCFDGEPCTQDICDQFTGKCVFMPLAGPCEDGNLCTINDHCKDGKCVPGAFKNCDDNNPCTDNKCNTGTGECFYPNNSNPCEDGNHCTVGDYCLNGGCKAGSPKNCDDTNICTNETCNPQMGCIYTPNNGLPCDDNNVCTVDEKCSGGQCLGGKDFCWNKVCTPVPPQVFCFQPQCVELPFVGPTCPCVCI